VSSFACFNPCTRVDNFLYRDVIIIPLWRKRYGPPYGMQLNAKNGQISFFWSFR
jgi:hypothetical protein